MDGDSSRFANLRRRPTDSDLAGNARPPKNPGLGRLGDPLLQIPDVYASTATDAAVARILRTAASGSGSGAEQASSTVGHRVAGANGSAPIEDRALQPGGTQPDDRISRTPGDEPSRIFAHTRGKPGNWKERFVVAAWIAVALFTGFVAWDRARLARRQPSTDAVGNRVRQQSADVPRIDRRSFSQTSDRTPVGIESESPAGVRQDGAAEEPGARQPAARPSRSALPATNSPSADVVEAVFNKSDQPRTSRESRQASYAQASSSQEADVGHGARLSSATGSNKDASVRSQSRTTSRTTAVQDQMPSVASGEGSSALIEPFKPRLLLPRMDDHDAQ